MLVLAMGLGTNVVGGELPPQTPVGSLSKSPKSDTAKQLGKNAPLPKDSGAITSAKPLADTAKPKIDTLDVKQLPPRILPLKQQMMFAGGVMIFLTLMMSSMQNFNPND